MSVIKQGISYGFVGAIQLCVDWLTFIILTQLGVITGPANIVARITGAALGFWMNGRWTFNTGDRRSLNFRQLVRFLVSWSLTTLISTAIVTVAAHTDGIHAAWIVKPVGDLALAAVGFAISKYWIYR